MTSSVSPDYRFRSFYFMVNITSGKEWHRKHFYIFLYLQLVNISMLRSDEMKESLLYKEPVDPANWVGLQKSDDLLGYLTVRTGNNH